MIEIPNSDAGAGPSPSGAPAAPGGASPSSGTVGDAAHQAERQAAADALVAAGQMTKEQADAWLAPAAPVPAGAPGTASQLHIDETAAFIGGLGPHEAARWLDGDVKAGLLSRQQADALLAGRSDPEAAAEAAKGGKPVERTEADLRAEGVKFDFGGMHNDETSKSAEHQALDWTARAWLVEAGFEKGPGSFLAQQANRCGIAWQKMNDGERHLHAQHQDVVLRDLWKGDYANNMSLAAQLVAELDAKRPGLRDLLASTGAAYDTLVISQIYNRAKELADKRGITWPPK